MLWSFLLQRKGGRLQMAENLLLSGISTFGYPGPRNVGNNSICEIIDVNHCMRLLSYAEVD